MKKIWRYTITFIFVLCFMICSALAASPQTVSEKETVYLDDGSYIEIITTTSSPTTRATITDIERSYTYKTFTGTKIFNYTLYGRFEYDGTTSKATDCSYTSKIYQYGWKLDDHLEYCSSSTVYGAAKFSSSTSSKTISGSISCDKDGNITYTE